MDFIKNRRTIRKYQQKDIPAELLILIMQESNCNNIMMLIAKALKPLWKKLTRAIAWKK